MRDLSWNLISVCAARCGSAETRVTPDVIASASCLTPSDDLLLFFRQHGVAPLALDRRILEEAVASLAAFPMQARCRRTT